jgi:hypothetical protein
MIIRLTCLFVSLAAAASASTVVRRGATCRCTSDQECWPSQSDFQTLSSQLSQPLIYPFPIANACYPQSNPSGNCTNVTLSFEDITWRTQQPGAYQILNWETFTEPNGTIEACFLNTTLGFPCDQGSVPVIGVDARTPEDVQTAVKFASYFNLRLAIKNTGSVVCSLSIIPLKLTCDCRLLVTIF